jgi:peptide subunit release factor 1 (eRF1)
VLAEIYSDGNIKILINEDSLVPNKQGSGGQSSVRFSRNRENAIVQWYKTINEYITPITKDITLGIQFCVQEKFLSYLHTYNKAKIKNIERAEYCNISGVYQFLERLKEKKVFK